jgi:predicted RNA-binding protein YlqC (UPF0109 family)
VEKWLEMKELITYIAKVLVDKPEEVVVTEKEGEPCFEESPKHVEANVYN